MSTNETDTTINYSLTYSIKFVILISFLIPSILISIIIFTYFGSNHRVRVTYHNHSILYLLLINFLQVLTDLPMPINYFHLNGFVQPSTSIYCIWWTWYEFSLNTTNGFLMAWISIERHFLIFHNNFLRNLGIQKRRLFHSIPLIICSLWGPLYYLLTIIITPMCINIHNFNSLLCGLPCYLFTNWGIFDLFFDVIIPVLIIFICNLSLFLRIIYQNMIIIGRIRHNWKRQRKMAFQLGIISFVYLIIWIPLSIIQLGQNYINPSFLIDYLDTFNFLIYTVPLILPFLCLLSMPELIQRLKNFLFQRQHTNIIPINVIQIRQYNFNQTSRNSVITRF